MIELVKSSTMSKVMTVLVVAGFITLISSCAATTDRGELLSESNTRGLPTAELPQYRVGTKYVYSNGTWETVSNVGPEGVTWINHRGFESTGSPDFTYKRLKWQTKDRHGMRKYNQAQFWLNEKTTTLWPLQPGNKTRYDEYSRVFTSSGIDQSYDAYWSCEVEGTERISVVAGDFDTWKITCKRYPNSFRSTSRVREYRTWYYAPAINHWVLEVRDYNGYRENRRKELAAVLPDVSTFMAQEEDVVSIKKQFQNTLEANQKEDTATWVNSQGQLLVSITPKGLFRIGNGDVCRQYHQVFTEAGMAHQYPGIACRNNEGRWVVPRR